MEQTADQINARQIDNAITDISAKQVQVFERRHALALELSCMLKKETDLSDATPIIPFAARMIDDCLKSAVASFMVSKNLTNVTDDCTVQPEVFLKLMNDPAWVQSTFAGVMDTFKMERSAR